jgi:hypothetical protein
MSSAPANLEHNELGIGAMTNVAATIPPNQRQVPGDQPVIQWFFAVELTAPAVLTD